jgi:MFS family permease
MTVDSGNASLAPGRGFRAVSRYQWIVFLIVWMGWTLDSADFGLFSLVLRPALTNLLGYDASGTLTAAQLAEIGKFGGLLSMMGLLGWALGGFVFGVIADYIGRVRALMFSVALYSVFTALQGLSHGIFDFAIYRFIAGLGTGAELMVGIPLLAETLGETHRAKIAGVMMTGGALGTFLGAWIYGLVGGYTLRLDSLIAGVIPVFKLAEGGPGSWRTVFFIGVVPALLLMFIRRRVMEPDRFNDVRARRQAAAASGGASREDREFLRFAPMQLFSPEHRYNTIVGMLFGLGSLLAIWTTNIWLPTILSLMVQKGGVSAAEAVPFVSQGIMVWSFGGIGGYIGFGFIADLIGRRATVTIYSAGAIAAGLLLYLGLSTYEPWYPVVLPIFGFFVFGVFSGYAIYLPELFPTQVRSTAVGFCTGSARIVTSFGPLVAGLLVGAFGGSFNKVTAVMTCMAIFSIIAMAMGRETKGVELPR